MKYREKSITGPDGQALYSQYWWPEETPQKMVLLVHGAGEHSGRYQHVAEMFVRNQYGVAALDLPGHGKSPGARCYIPSMEYFTSSVRCLHEEVKQQFEHTPLILLGHSMGGLIASLYLLEHQREITACVLSGPAIKSDLQPGVVQLTIIKILSALLPKLGVLQLDASGVSRDTAEVQKYLNDPLVYNGKLPARLIAELFRGMNRLVAEAHNIDVPMLLLHGSEDVMASPKSSQFMYDTIASKNKTLKIYPGLYHEIFNEPEKAAVLADLMEWCRRV